MNKLCRSLFLCGLLSLYSILSHAKELTVGIGTINYPPYYFEKDGLMQGAVIEISQHIADKLGHTLVYRQYPWPRIQFYLQTGKIDMVILYFKTPERENNVVYTDTPHIYDSSHLFIKKSTPIHFDENLNSLYGYHFGNVRGYSHGPEYDNSKLLSKQEAGDENQLIRMLLNGRIDIAVGNKVVINVHAKKKGALNEITFLNFPIHTAPAYFAFSKTKTGSDKLAHEFSIQVRELLPTKKYQKILEKYGFEYSELLD